MNLKFLENNRDELIQLTINHRKSEGFGCMFIDLTSEDNAHVTFLSIAHERFPCDLRKTLLERRGQNSESVAYFVCSTKDETNIVEIDLAK